MNITEAFKLLQEGKKISHKDSPYAIWQLFDSELIEYRQNDKKAKHYIFSYVSGNCLTIDCSTMLNGWSLVTKPLSINFKNAKYFYDKGMTIKRIKSDKCFNNTDLAHNTFIMEDIEANDWVIMEWEN